MKRYMRLYRLFWRNSFRREAEFRANFWAKVVTNVAWLAFFVLTVEVIYSQTSAVAGWSRAEGLMLSGICYFVTSVASLTFYPNLSQIPNLVQQGTMDFVFTRPIRSVFWVSFRFVNLDEIGSLLGAIALIAYSWRHLPNRPEMPEVAGFVVLVLAALVMLYALYLFMMSTAFWLVRVDNLVVLIDTMLYTARFPTDVFQGLARRLFTWVLPVAFIATAPASVLAGKAGINLVGWGAGLSALFLLAALRFWAFASRHYSSASS